MRIPFRSQLVVIALIRGLKEHFFSLVSRIVMRARVFRRYSPPFMSCAVGCELTAGKK
jgi:hypothetical protein